jgi:hypothetical protein
MLLLHANTLDTTRGSVQTHRMNLDPETGQPVQPQPRFDPYTGKPLDTAPRFDPFTGQRLNLGVTRFIARPPSGWWIATQAIWLLLIALLLIAVAVDTSGNRADGVLGGVFIYVLGALLFGVISYAYRRTRRLP